MARDAFDQKAGRGGDHRTPSRRTFVLALGLGALALGTTPAVATKADDGCEKSRYAGARYIVCRFDPASVEVRIVWRDSNNAAFGSLGAVRRAVRRSGREFLFAMNAGMYHQDLSPVGYHVEHRKKLKNANTRRGPGNFHLLPNGIFFLENGRAGVMETRAFLKRNKRPEYATQSGPMLVINGRIHPKFNPASTSRKSRNGVGVSKDGRSLIFALSEEPVTFHQFARLFQRGLKTENALFLDGGSVPQMQSKSMTSLSFAPVGPVVAVMRTPSEKRTGVTR
ncbi:MAG: phosphodiester glycosidase family protein [Pseudomonadota bacterium]